VQGGYCAKAIPTAAVIKPSRHLLTDRVPDTSRQELVRALPIQAPKAPAFARTTVVIILLPFQNSLAMVRIYFGEYHIRVPLNIKGLIRDVSNDRCAQIRFAGQDFSSLAFAGDGEPQVRIERAVNDLLGKVARWKVVLND
jgi:hypothetical protein